MKTIPNDLRAAHGIVNAIILSVLLWALIGALVWGLVGCSLDKWARDLNKPWPAITTPPTTTTTLPPPVPVPSSPSVPKTEPWWVGTDGRWDVVDVIREGRTINVGVFGSSAFPSSFPDWKFHQYTVSKCWIKDVKNNVIVILKPAGDGNPAWEYLYDVSTLPVPCWVVIEPRPSPEAAYTISQAVYHVPDPRKPGFMKATVVKQ